MLFCCITKHSLHHQQRQENLHHQKQKSPPTWRPSHGSRPVIHIQKHQPTVQCFYLNVASAALAMFEGSGWAQWVPIFGIVYFFQTKYFAKGFDCCQKNIAWRNCILQNACNIAVATFTSSGYLSHTTINHPVERTLCLLTLISRRLDEKTS